MWREHQGEILLRLGDGTLNLGLSRKAALRTTARLAICVFGATRTMTIMRTPSGSTESYISSVGIHVNLPLAKARDLLVRPNFHITHNSTPDTLDRSSIVVAAWLWPGYFMTRSPEVIWLFDTTYQWPTLLAFDQAVKTMRERVDATPQGSSLLISCYSIDGADLLTIQQTSLAIATADTRLLATIDEDSDVDTMRQGRIRWFIDQTTAFDEINQIMEAEASKLNKA